MRKLIPLLIITFWAVMMGMHIKREVLPSLAPPPSFKSLKPGDYKMKILLGSIHLGNMQTTITQNADRSFTIQETVTLKKNFITRGSEFKLQGKIKTTPKNELDNFEYSITILGEIVRLIGTQKEDCLEIVKITKNDTTLEQYPSRKQDMFSGGLMPVFDMTNLSVGKEWSINWMDPLGFSSPEIVNAKVQAKETIPIGDKQVETYLINLEYQNKVLNIWVDMNGEIVKFSSSGLVFIREGI